MKTIKYLLVLLILALATPTTYSQNLEVKALIESAEKGAWTSQLCLGMAYFGESKYSSLGLPKDNSKAIYYLTLAALNPNTPASDKAIIGLMLCTLHGEMLNKEEKLYWGYYSLSVAKQANVYKLMLHSVIPDFITEGYVEKSERIASETLNLFILYYMLLDDKEVETSIDFLTAIHVMLVEPAEIASIQPAKSLSFGLLRNEDGTYKYIGEKSNGKPNGFGLLFLKNTVYCGEFKDGKYHGKGWLEYKDTKSMIDGEWRDGKIYNGYYYEDGNLDEPFDVYENGKPRCYANFTRLDVGKEDKKGYIIPTPVELSLSVRWASELMGDGKQIYHWGSTNPYHEFQSKDPSAPNYLPRATCLAIYGGAGCNYDITGSGYDAAKCLWASGWRMPTVKEMQELINSCDIVSIDYDVVNIAPQVTIKRSSVTDLMGELSFVIPRSPDGYGIWTGSIDPNDNEKAYALIVDMVTESVRIESRDRECQFAILPVTDIQYFKKPLYRIKQ